MRMVFGLVLIAGFGLAGFAVYMAQGYFDQYEAALEQARSERAAQVTVAEIYVAAKPLRYGQILTPEDVRRIKFPAESLPEGVFQEETVLFPDANARPRTVLRAMEVNEPLLAVKVTAPGQSGGVATVLAPGMRAFAINVDVSSGVSGFLAPGYRVDVYWSGSINGRSLTQLIEPNVTIIAIDQSADQDNLNPTIARTVTVEVRPEQVAALAQAQATGRLSLSLVGISETGEAGQVEVDQGTLLGVQEEAPVEAPVAERICTIKTRRGAEEVEVQIPCTN